nr:retrovirus-related Pol polyprotein from transposon TNT 1-94 [Tanacetum cinerariifolium]
MGRFWSVKEWQEKWGEGLVRLAGNQVGEQWVSNVGKKEANYALEILNKYGMLSSDPVDTPMVENDVDHIGCQDTRRSTSGSAQFLGEKLVSWSSKKQKSTTISSIEAEYIALSRAIALCCNNVQHSRSKHIDVRYYFIKEQVENRVVELYFIRIEYQLADIFTKALPRERFNFLIDKLGLKSISPKTLKHLAKKDEE